MVKSVITTTTTSPNFDWDSVWFSDETIVEARQTLVEALYVALSPGSLPSACVFAFDCTLTIIHFVVSSYILDDFTTTFLGTVYFPCTFGKAIYLAECLTSAEWIRDVNNAMNQIFNMTIILSSVAYNFMCLFVANYRKNIPNSVCRYVFGPILLFCTFLVIAPKLVVHRNVDNFFQFTTQLFGSVCLLAQIAYNLYLFLFKKIDLKSEKSELKLADDVTKANDVIRNANGRLVWASWFSFVLVLLAIPQIVDYYVPNSDAWLPYHFLSRSVAQLNALLLSFTIFVVLPTYRSVIFSCCANYNRIIKVEEVKIEKEHPEVPRSGMVKKAAEALANHRPILPIVRHVAVPMMLHHHHHHPAVHTGAGAHHMPQIKIFVGPHKF